MIQSYRELKVWQKAMDLVVACYQSTADFPKAETYGLSSQLRRAAVSIPANIAEGQGRQHTKEFLQFLGIAGGSLAELETHIQIAQRLHYMTKETSDSLLEQCDEIGRMFTNLTRALQAKLTNH